MTETASTAYMMMQASASALAPAPLAAPEKDDAAGGGREELREFGEFFWGSTESGFDTQSDSKNVDEILELFNVTAESDYAQNDARAAEDTTEVQGGTADAQAGADALSNCGGVQLKVHTPVGAPSPSTSGTNNSPLPTPDTPPASPTAGTRPRMLVVPVVPKSTPNSHTYSDADFKGVHPRVLATISCLFDTGPVVPYGALGCCASRMCKLEAAGVPISSGVTRSGVQRHNFETKRKRGSEVKREITPETCAIRSAIAAKRKRVGGRFMKDSNSNQPRFI